ncbi:MAG: T9SS type A sorting domain-containing protein, partial [Bacteroidota bacterium]
PQRETAIKVFPNPARASFHIEVGNNSLPAILEVRDINGKTVLQKSLVDMRQDIHVGSLPAGIYLYRIIGHKEGIFTGRLVIQ